MPQLAATNNITDFPIFNNRVRITELGAVYEPTGNFRWVSPHMRIQAVSSQYDPSAGEGRSRVQVQYTDNTTFDVEISDTPFDSFTGNISTSEQWVNCHGDGRWRPIGQAPSTTHNYTNSASDNLNEELAVAVNKTLQSMNFYWTDN